MSTARWRVALAHSSGFFAASGLGYILHGTDDTGFGLFMLAISAVLWIPAWSETWIQ